MDFPSSDYQWSDDTSPDESPFPVVEKETEDDDDLLKSSPPRPFSSSSNDTGNNLEESGFLLPSENEEAFYCSEAIPYPSTPAIVGAGLENLGNTCFLNSVLQCFMHTVPLLNGILLDRHSLQSTCTDEGLCALCALRELVMFSLANRVVSPSNFANNLSYFSSSFQKFQQEDAHEFLQCFLDRLESCHDLKHKDHMSSQSDNLVKQVFGGRLISKLKCCNCSHCSDTYEPLIDLSLEIEDADSLVSALQSFTKVEEIEDPETKFTCDKCKEQVSIEKQLSFDEAPSVAVFHLKRFKNDGCLVQKIDKHVAFPLDLDLLPFSGSGKTDDAELKYVLYAVVVHVGLTSTSGHYYCFIRLSPNLWCKFDDSRVVLVPEDFVLSQEAYILFYAKQGTPWFSSFIETKIASVDTAMWETSPKSVLDNVDASWVPPSLQNKFSLSVQNKVSPSLQNKFSLSVQNKVSPSLQNKVSFSLQNKFSYNSNDVTQNIGSEDSEHKGVRSNELKDSGGTQNKFESHGSTENLHRIPSAVALGPSDSSEMSSVQVQKECSPSLPEKVDRSNDVCAVSNHQNDNPRTPLRSPSPEIYREDPPDTLFSIPRHGMRSVERLACKRQLENDMDDDMETKQACLFIKKNMHSSRGQQMLAALRGSKAEASVNRKKSRPGSRDDSVASTHRDSSIRLRPVATRSYR